MGVDRREHPVQPVGDEQAELLVDVARLTRLVGAGKRQRAVTVPRAPGGGQQIAGGLRLLLDVGARRVECDAIQPQTRPRQRDVRLPQGLGRSEPVRVQLLDIVIAHEHAADAHQSADDEQNREKGHRHRKAGTNADILRHRGRYLGLECFNVPP